MVKNVMVIGLGNVGSWAVEILVRTPGLKKITTADVNEDYASRRTKAAICGASHLGYYPEVEFRRMNLMDLEQSAQILKDVNPTVILSTVSAITGYPGEVVSKERVSLIEDAGNGVFLPAQMLLIHKLIQAVNQAGINPHIVNASYNDAVAPILKRVGLRMPDIGIGNVDNLVPIIKMQVSQKMNGSMKDIRVYLVGHHFNNVWCTRRRPGEMCPYLMKIMLNGEDITHQFDTDELMLGTSKDKNRLGGTDGSSLTASSAVKHTLAFLNEIDLFTHSPGVKGYIGGYPVQIKSNKPEIALPDEITMQEAVKVNESGQYRDEIEEIRDDGTTIFTDEAVSLIKKAIGYECKVMRFHEHEERAKELLTKFNAHLRK